MRFQKLAGFVLVAAALCAMELTTHAAVRPPPSPFQCYTAETFSSSNPVTVQDQFENGTTTLLNISYLCAPLTIDGVSPSNAIVHLVCYTRYAGPLIDKPVRVRNLFAPNGQKVIVHSAFMDCVPARKKLKKPTIPPAVPKNPPFQCWTAQGALAEQDHTILDQFIKQPGNLVKVGPVYMLCAPLTLNGQAPRDSKSHLVCYTSSGGTDVNKSVWVYDRFYPTGIAVTVRVGGLLCLPSTKRLL